MTTAYTNRLTVLGRVTDVDVDAGAFTVLARSGDSYLTYVGTECVVNVLENLDELNNDRVPTPDGYAGNDPVQVVKKYVRLERSIVVEGILQKNDGAERFEARTLHLVQDNDGRFLFESPQWWLSQISRMSDVWLEDLFGPTETYQFSRYRTNIDITGRTDGLDQECATLSRLIYGLASAYLLTGSDRYLDAARAGVEFQRKNFRSMSHDSQFCLWAFAKDGKKLIIPSQNGDDFGAIPLYEQIYALAGLTQFYRITNDPETLLDIRRTVTAFELFWRDKSEFDGYFSHVDPVTMTADCDALGDNKLKKNWNSIGDHIPAYLVNLILALEPLPKRPDTEDIQAFLGQCKDMLQRTSTLIVEKFPDPDPEIPYVCERYYIDWKQDLTWRWQQDRAVCGHNLKIAWNLTRVANYYSTSDKPLADKLMTVADRLGQTMSTHAIDQVRSGVYDVVERRPKNGQPLQFAWWNTKDFWQQEQGILAYYILYGRTGNEEYLDLARENASFYNLFFLNHDDCGVYFRVTADGLPFLEGSYRDKGGHSISGYHTFELCYLSHLYISTFVTKRSFSLHFRPDVNCGQRSINVLPDFMEPSSLKVTSITVNGAKRSTVDPDNFRLELADDELGTNIVVEFQPVA